MAFQGSYKYLHCHYTFDFRWLLPPENGGNHHDKTPTQPDSTLIFGGQRAACQHPVFRG